MHTPTGTRPGSKVRRTCRPATGTLTSAAQQASTRVRDGAGRRHRGSERQGRAPMRWLCVCPRRTGLRQWQRRRGRHQLAEAGARARPDRHGRVRGPRLRGRLDDQHLTRRCQRRAENDRPRHRGRPGARAELLDHQCQLAGGGEKLRGYGAGVSDRADRPCGTPEATPTSSTSASPAPRPPARSRASASRPSSSNALAPFGQPRALPRNPHIRTRTARTRGSGRAGIATAPASPRAGVPPPRAATAAPRAPAPGSRA
jgi:hypothetical protein